MNRLLLSVIILLGAVGISMRVQGQGLWEKMYLNSFPSTHIIGYEKIVHCWDTARGGLIGYVTDSIHMHRRTVYVCLNAQGDTLWVKKNLFNTGIESVTSICRLSNGDFMVAAACDSPGSLTAISAYCRLKRIDSLGNDLFTKQLAGPDYLDFVDAYVLPAEGGGYYVASSFAKRIAPASSVWIDSLVGTTLFEKYDSNNIRTAVESFRSGDVVSSLLCPGSAFTTTRPSRFNAIKLRGMHSAADGGFFTVLHRDSAITFSTTFCRYLPKPGAKSGGFVCKFDTALHIQWCTNITASLHLQNDSMFVPEKAFATSDSGLIVIGGITDATERFGSRLTFMVKLDKSGILTDSIRVPEWVTVWNGVEASTGHCLVEISNFNHGLFMWIQGIAEFDKNLHLLRYTPQPITFPPYNRLGGMTANQYGGAFAPYFKDTVAYLSWRDVIPASFNFDSTLQCYPASVSGKVLLDTNRNCTYEPGTDRQLGKEGIILTDIATALKYVVRSDNNGNWARGVPLGTYNITPVPAPNKATECATGGFTVNLTTPARLSGWNIFDTLILSRQDMKVLLSSALFAPGFQRPLSAYVFNNGGTPSTDTLRITKPSGLNYVSASPTPNSVSGNTLTWILNNVAVDSMVFITVNLAAPATTTIGTGLSFSAQISGHPDANPADNIDTLYTEAVGPYDPNRKTVNRPMYTAAGGDWIYTIEFQNTGNYPAQDVVITDKLDSRLDIATLRLLSASHGLPEMQWRDGNELLFRFDNINLADSVHNEPASHGFVSFSIRPARHVGTNDSITNSASIYFDFNPPIQTNSTLNIITAPYTSVPGMVRTQHMKAYPNPTSGDFTLESDAAGEGTFYDMQGRILLRLPIAQGTSHIGLPPGLAAGIYVLQGRSTTGSALGVLRIVVK